MKKRGQSGVISVMLIISIALVALFIVGGVIFGILREGESGGDIEAGLVRGDIKSVIIEPYGKIMQITLERPNGNADPDLSGIKFIFEDSKKNTYVQTIGVDLLDELQTKNYVVDANNVDPELEDFKDIKKIFVYYIIGEGSKRKISPKLDSHDMSKSREDFVLSATRYDLIPQTKVSRPSYLQAVPGNYEDYGYNITRVSGDAIDMFNGEIATTTRLVIDRGTSRWVTSNFRWGDIYTSNRYVTDSPWNVNGELIYVKSGSTPTNDFILNGTSYEVLYSLSRPYTGGAARWSQNPETPKIVYGFQSGVDQKEDNGIVYIYQLATSGDTNEAPPTQPSPYKIDMHYPTSLDFSGTGGFNGKDSQGISGKGSVIYVDGSEYVALHGRSGEEAVIYIMNLSSGLKIGDSFVITDNCGLDQIPIDYCEKIQAKDSPRFSPDGNYLLVSYADEDSYGTRILEVDLTATGANVIQDHSFLGLPDCPPGFETDPSCSGYVYSSDPSKGFLNFHMGHPVFTYGKGGDMYIVGNIPTKWYGQEVNGWATIDRESKLGSVVAINLRTNEFFSLTDPDDECRGTHFSGVAVDNPGWVIVTYNNEKDLDILGTYGHTTFKTRRYNNEIIAIDIEGYEDLEKGVIRLGQTKTTLYPDGTVGSYTYNAEAHGVPSPDGKYVMFRSCWEPCNYPMNASAYIIEANLPKLTT
jgi:hypothetical protein